MEISNNVLNILTAKSLKGIGTAWILDNINGTETIDDIVEMHNKTKKFKEFFISAEEFKKRRNHFEQEVLQVHKVGVKAVALGDPDFPRCRGNVNKSEQPVVLFYKGDISLLKPKNFNVCVIGLLQPDENIELRERKVVSELVHRGATIVSGLALGCDSIAHQECLKIQGTTVAILPSPINKIMPSSNTKLAHDILASGGLLISEYYKEFSSKNEMIARYIERDRLQALFSNGIVLAASYAKNNQKKDSGSRHAMMYAKKYGIPSAVIYNHELDKDNEKYALNFQILNENTTVHRIDDLQTDTIISFVVKVKSVPQGKNTEQCLMTLIK